VRAPDSGSREGVAKWSLVCRRVGQKSPIEDYAQETAELTGGLGRLAVLKMDHSFFQRLGARGGHLVNEEGDLGCSEDALRRVDEDPIPLKSVEEPVDVVRVPRETGRKWECRPSRRLRSQFTRNPKCERKSLPMRGCVTSGTTNFHVKFRRSPRLRLRGSHP
jgi:hypothetical protein